MDNIILSGMLKSFAARHEFLPESTDKQFEKFANYCLLKTDYYDSFDFDKVSTGKCVGIDGAAVVINGVIVNELGDATAFTKGQFEVKFSFSQAKTSPKFDLGDFLKFVSTVKLFFGNDESAIPKELRNAFSIKKLIYDRAAKLSQLPTVELSYVYSGRFDIERSQITPLIESEIAALKAMPYLFSEVSWYIHDGDAIARLYRETQNEIQKTITFQRHVALPTITGTRAAYLGVVRCKDYVSLIQKENGELNRGLFFENVRDFLGDSNVVNEDIAKTIHSLDERDRFAILNNGVTIVSKKVDPKGDNFELNQFQVVNGCQTSHVLFNNRTHLSDDMFMTVKLIETSDVDLSGKIIATTNSQSHVTKEAFATIKPYHRGLEDFFNAMRSSGYNYYYERRPHQYDYQDNIMEHCIVSAPSLIKSFISVVMEEPEKVHFYYGRLLIEYNRNQSSELFSDSDYPGLYFAAHHIASRSRAAIANNRDLKEWIFHISLLVKKQIAPELSKGIILTDKKFLKVLERIDEQFDEAYKQSIKVIQAAKLDKNKNRVPETTKAMLQELKSYIFKPTNKNSPSSDLFKLADGLYAGTVQSIDKEKQVVVKYGPYIINAILNSDFSSELKEGDRVSLLVANKAKLIQIQERINIA